MARAKTARNRFFGNSSLRNRLAKDGKLPFALSCCVRLFQFPFSRAGGWPSLVRPVIDLVDPWYAAAFLPYVTLVVFAVLRIVTALFLKETLASAAQDAELVIEETRRTAIKYQEKLVDLFKFFDDDGDGHLTPDEFIEAMSLPSVQQYLRFLDVSVRDVRPLFDILSDGDGLITISEFCKGLMQLKGQARALDMVLLQHENTKLLKRCEDIHRMLSGRRRSVLMDDKL